MGRLTSSQNRLQFRCWREFDLPDGYFIRLVSKAHAHTHQSNVLGVNRMPSDFYSSLSHGFGSRSFHGHRCLADDGVWIGSKRNRIWTMTVAPDPLLPREASTPSVPQWLGLRSDGRTWALSVSDVSAVFRARTGTEVDPLPAIDVELHGGGPVFMAPMSMLFKDLSDWGDPGPQSESWVVVLSPSIGSNLGFRVEQVHGPFQGEPLHGQVMDSHESWQILKPELQHA